jgi:hypothetical protein
MNCEMCGKYISSTDATRNICDDINCQKRAEYYPFLEPVASMSFDCPHCHKLITLPIHKGRS